MATDAARTAGPRRPGHLSGLLVLLILPLALRLWPIEHGLPRNYVPDTHVVRSALGMARDKDPIPRVGQYSTYPNLLPYALLPVYGAQYYLGRATGAWSGAGEFANVVMERPEVVHLPARILIALLAALTPWVVFRGARAAGLRGGAWVAAWLVATGLLHTHFSIQERPWAPVVFFLALSCWPAALYVRHGSARLLLFSGLAAAGAAACHQAGVPALGIAGLAWLFGPLGWKGSDLQRRLAHGALAVGAFAVLALAVGYPHLLRYGTSGAAELSGGELLTGDETTVSLGGQAFVLEVRWASLARLTRAFFGYDPALVILGLLGLAGGLALRTTRPALVFALLWAAVFLTNRNDHVRYLLPLAVLLPFAAGIAGELLWQRRLGRVLLVPLLALPLVQDLRLGWVLRHTDTRAVGEALLAGLGADPAHPLRIAVEPYGPLVAPSAESLDRLAGWRELRTREAHRVSLLEALAEGGAMPADGAGLDVVMVEDLFTFDQRAGTYAVRPALAPQGASAREVLRSLGVTHVLLVDRRPGDADPPLLLRAPPADSAAPPPLKLTRPPLFTVDPSEGAGCDEAFLPTEMDFPLTALWQVLRPGPRLELFALE